MNILYFSLTNQSKPRNDSCPILLLRGNACPEHLVLLVMFSGIIPGSSQATICGARDLNRGQLNVRQASYHLFYFSALLSSFYSLLNCRH